MAEVVQALAHRPTYDSTSKTSSRLAASHRSRVSELAGRLGPHLPVGDPTIHHAATLLSWLRAAPAAPVCCRAPVWSSRSPDGSGSVTRGHSPARSCGRERSGLAVTVGGAMLDALLDTGQYALENPAVPVGRRWQRCSRPGSALSGGPAQTRSLLTTVAPRRSMRICAGGYSTATAWRTSA